MLGIRRFKGRTIDLWCGEADDFAAPASSRLPDGAISQALAWHLALKPFESEEPVDLDLFFDDLKERLSSLSDDSPLRRVTIIADDLLRYQRLMEHLYRRFDEVPWR